jgi:hypothetical protein
MALYSRIKRSIFRPGFSPGYESKNSRLAGAILTPKNVLRFSSGKPRFILDILHDQSLSCQQSRRKT